MRAVWARIAWRLRWAITAKPCHLRLADQFDLLVPKTGSGLFLYSYGFSEPETAGFVRAFLKPGMTFWDVGAHVGEYTLLASSCVGPSGRVEAFEPQPGIFEVLSRNVEVNAAGNVKLRRIAVGDRVGTVSFRLHADPSKSNIGGENALDRTTHCTVVPATTLDNFRADNGVIPHLIKVDVEGAERLVLLGARSVLELPPESAPVWLMEFDPHNGARFDYHPNQFVDLLRSHGYLIFWLTNSSELRPWDAPPPWFYGNNLVASKLPIAADATA